MIGVLKKLEIIIILFVGMIIGYVPKILANRNTRHRLKSEINSSLKSILNCKNEIDTIWKDDIPSTKERCRL